MKGLTVSRMAAARLRANRKAYLSLIIGIFLSVFLVTTLVLCIQGVILAQMEQTNKRLGYEDAILLDTPELSDGDLAEMGYFDSIGHVYVSAGVKDTDLYLGWYDDTGASLLSRQLLEGRLPEHPGEIAMERSAMLAIREDGQWQLGEEVTLKLIPIDGLEEERSFTLVGFLAEQSGLLTNSYSSGMRAFVSGFPAILVSSGEPPFSSGRIALHRVMTRNAPISEELFQAVSDRIDAYASGRFLVKTIEGKLLDSYYPTDVLGLNSDVFMLAIMAGLLILSLLLSCGVGIAGSMEGILGKRREEIGILRALGATKRQIRRIFGRESWLLALTAAPGSIALSCLFVWCLQQWMPENMIFRLNPILLLPIIVLSAAVILVSGSVPLRRASNQMPMSVIRDTGLLRKSKHIRSRKQFRVPALISRRLMRLYPTRLLGAVILSALMCFCAALLAIVICGGTYTFSPSSPAYTIRRGGLATRSFVSFSSGQPLSDQSLNQLRSLPHVQKVTVRRSLPIGLQLENRTSYFTATFSRPNYHLMSFEDYREYLGAIGSDADTQILREQYDAERQDYNALRKSLGISQEMAYTSLISVPAEELTKLAQYLGSGRIDVDAINAGQEVLALAPRVWYMPDQDRYTTILSQAQEAQAVFVAENDWARAGQALPMVQLYSDDPEAFSSGEILSLLAGCTRLDAAVTVGGVLEETPPALGGLWGSVITTEDGLRSMGLYRNGDDTVHIYLDGVVDEDTEAGLTESVNAIARRAEGSRVYNYMESARENAQSYLRLFLLMGAIAIVFFAVAAGMIVSTVTRQLQSDGQRIGMLRAVGADEKTILRCYSGQVFLSLGLGMAFAILVLAVLFATSVLDIPAGWYPPGIAAILLFSGLCMGLCSVLLRRRVHQVTLRSVVENIREL